MRKGFSFMIQGDGNFEGDMTDWLVPWKRTTDNPAILEMRVAGAPI